LQQIKCSHVWPKLTAAYATPAVLFSFAWK
jgi:hypothetical protein